LGFVSSFITNPKINRPASKGFNNYFLFIKRIMSTVKFLNKECLNETFFNRCRSSNSLFNKINDNFEEYIKTNILTYYSGHIQLPITCDDSWLLAINTQNKLIRSVNEFPCNTHIITTCIDIHNEPNNSSEKKEIKSFSDLNIHIKKITSDMTYEKFRMPNDKLDIIINYWENLLFISKDNKDLFNYISGVLNNYYTSKELLGDNYFNPSAEEDNTISPLGYIEVVTNKVKEMYDIPDIYDNTKCRGKCTAMYNKKEPCDQCKKEKELKECKNCGNNYKAEYEELCYNCYIDVELEKEKKIWNKKLTNYKKLNNNKFETWISQNNNLYTLTGRPCIQFTILKTQQSVDKTKDILKFIQNLLGNDYIIHLHTSFSRASCPSINALMYAWKNIDYNYTIKLINKNNNEWVPACKTFVTKMGFPLFDKLKIILEEFEKHPSQKYNPYMVLEVDSNVDKSNNDSTIDWTKTNNSDATNDYKSKVNTIPTPIEENESLQAIEVFAKFMCDNGYRVNEDNTVWVHNKSTKMTFEKTCSIDKFFNRVALRLSAKDKALVDTQKQYIISALEDSGSDNILYSAIPRIKQSYRMIEFNDGFLDLVNKCIYKEQNEIPCYICYNDVKLSSIYEEIESNFIGISQWYKVCLRSGLWYIEYLYNLYNQLQVTISNRNILIHIGNNYDQLIFLLNPFLKLFPTDINNKVKTTINQAEAKKLQSVPSPVVFQKSNIKLLEQCLELYESKVLKCGSIHNSNQSFVENNSNFKEHVYSNLYLDTSLEEDEYTTFKELPYIVIFTALCSNAVINRTQSLYKLPVYENITPSKQEIFNRACDYLYGVTHTNVYHSKDPEVQLSKAFTTDLIAYQNNTIINNNIVNIPINNPLPIVDTQPAKKRRGRPRKELIIRDTLPPAYEQ
jgi:hypothetical protein